LLSSGLFKLLASLQEPLGKVDVCRTQVLVIVLPFVGLQIVCSKEIIEKLLVKVIIVVNLNISLIDES
jgi:hypothetical protein